MDLFYLVWIFCEFVESIVGGVVIAILVAIALIVFGIYSLVTYNPEKKLVSEINALNDEDYAVLLRHLLELNGYTYIHRSPTDAFVVLGEMNGQRHMWACLNKKIDSHVVNKVWQISEGYDVDCVKICCQEPVENSVINYADTLDVRMISNHTIAGKYLEAKREKELPRTIKETVNVPLQVWGCQWSSDRITNRAIAKNSSKTTDCRVEHKNEAQSNVGENIVTSKKTSIDEKANVKRYSGKGDSVIDVEPVRGGWFLYAKCSCENGSFGVEGFDAKNDWSSNFVNSDEAYEGTTWDSSQETVYIQVSASDEWVIEIRPISVCEALSPLMPYEGKGDRILMLTGTRTRVQLEKYGNGDCEVDTYSFDEEDESFCFADELIDTDTDYSGTLLLKYNPDIIIVKAEGTWKVTLK